jgi:hypothetical protein
MQPRALVLVRAVIVRRENCNLAHPAAAKFSSRFSSSSASTKMLLESEKLRNLQKVDSCTRLSASILEMAFRASRVNSTHKENSFHFPGRKEVNFLIAAARYHEQIII